MLHSSEPASCSGPSPRVRGNHADGRAVALRQGSIPGPSPRVRGNPRADPDPESYSRSIPACAGKPRSGCPNAGFRQVHPRVCGETQASCFGPKLFPGPSPRVRGNPEQPAIAAAQGGSIPACAGKPAPGRPQDQEWRVHPRVCGETPPGPDLDDSVTGPSPRVRGNHFLVVGLCERRGSIPACAGKPISIQPSRSERWVHPRVCGETP